MGVAREGAITTDPRVGVPVQQPRVAGVVDAVARATRLSGSEVDFPVGNSSFFLFFSGHVGASVIAALDMRRMGRTQGAAAMDIMNVAQTLRLLATRGHYTIDLVSGAVAGWACYHLAGWYEQGMAETALSMESLQFSMGGDRGSGDSSLFLDRKDSSHELD